jgi:outer membrane receptor protein involved in Fe transport
MTKIFLILLFVLLGYMVKSQEDSLKVIPIGEVVVTSQRSPQLQVAIPYSVNTITRKEMDQFSPRTTPEALMGMNGVFVQKTNHGGGSPFIRGLTGNQTLLLIDGIRLNNSIYRYGPNQYLNTVDPFLIDKIEVAKGTGSVQYGTDALSGALQLFTKELQFSPLKQHLGGKVLGKYMTGDMEKTGRSQLEYSSKKFALLVGGTYRDFGDLIGGKNTGKQTPSGYNEYAFDAKMIFALKDNIQLTFANQFLKQMHVPVYHKVVLENYQLNEFNPQERLLSYARLEIQGKSRWIDQVKLTASYQQNTEGRLSQKNGSNILVSERDQVNTLGLNLEVNSKISDYWLVNSGIETYNDVVDSKRSDLVTTGSAVSTEKRGLYPDNSKYRFYSLYSIHRLTLGRWILNGGVRWNTFNIKLHDVTLGDVDISPEAAVFNSGVMYNLNSRHHIYTNFSNGFRAPNINDMGTLGIVDFRYEVPGYNLKPEKSRNYEMGYKLRLPRFFGTVALYRSDLNQLITRVKEDGRMIDGYQVYHMENVEEAYIQGFEAGLNWKLKKYIEINCGVTSTYGQNVTKDEPLRRIPPFNGRFAATYTLSKYFAGAEFLFASKQDRLAAGDKSDNRIPAGGTPGWEVTNLYAGYQLDKIHFNLALQNLFDVDYRTHGSGINGIGRSTCISIEWIF